MSDELTPREVAAALGVTVRTVQRWAAEGRIHATRVGGRVRVSRSSLASIAPAAADPAATRGIRRLLVANRGEIAERIARTARAMGIAVVGVHERDERPPATPDEVHLIASYLDGGELLRVAEASGADAIHPGYGFLAENAGFAAAVERAGLTWVGPPAAAIAAMGDKAAARRRAAEAGVAVVPGDDGEAQDEATLANAARRIGLPLLVKPSAGGGGKGMRVVDDLRELSEALAAARREAHRSFGDDRLVLERHVERPRHVEIQVLFDAHGAGVHLGERDCSAQRRNQKVVEESPGPAVDDELRRRMGTAALAVAASVGYVNAGTVEFLLTNDGEFFFLEMNTRLQVEHPVTELVTGRDLVADQLRIAGGEALGFTQAEVRLEGHAVEARLYAEDPESGFLPASGRLLRVSWPPGVRVDTGAVEGDEVSDRYDPLLAKIVVHAANRGGALDALREALAATVVLGVRTNLRFLRWLVEQPAMRDGELRTDDIAAMSLPPPPPVPGAAWALAARTLAQPAAAGGSQPWSGGWRLNAAPRLRLRAGDEERSIAVTPAAGGEPPAVREGDAVHLDVEGRSVEIRLAPAPTVEEAVRHAAAHAGGAAALVAPMPGRVVAIRAAEGAVVEAHAPVVVVEAMKMEHAVVAPMAARVARVAIEVGQQVQRGEVLAELEPATDADGSGT